MTAGGAGSVGKEGASLKRGNKPSLEAHSEGSGHHQGHIECGFSSGYRLVSVVD